MAHDPFDIESFLPERLRSRRAPTQRSLEDEYQIESFLPERLQRQRATRTSVNTEALADEFSDFQLSSFLPERLRKGAKTALPEPETPGMFDRFVRPALNVGQAILNIPAAGAGAIAGAITGGFDHETSPYVGALESNIAGMPGGEVGIIDALRAAPGPGQVLAEAEAPGRVGNAPGRIAKRLGGVVGDILLDPLTYASGGLTAAQKLAKAGRPIEAAARVLGSAPAALVHAPDVATGTYEAGRQAFEAAQAGDWDQATESGIEAALMAALGAGMAHGTRGELRDFRADRAARAAAAVPPVAPTPDVATAADTPPPIDLATPAPELDLDATQPLSVFVGEPPVTPQFRPEGPPVDVLAEREFLRPDPAAAVDAEQARLGRAFLGQRAADAEAFSRAQPPGPSFGAAAGDMVPEQLGGALEQALQAPPAAPRLAGLAGRDQLGGALEQALQAPPAEPRLAPPGGLAGRDQAEAARLAPMLAQIPDVELGKRERFYRRSGLQGAGDLVREEIARRAAAAESAQQRTDVREWLARPEEPLGVPPEALPPEAPVTPQGIPPPVAVAPPPRPTMVQTEAPGLLDVERTQPDVDRTLPQPRQPRYAYRARDVGETGVPAVSHAQASMSEADVRRMAPSRSDAPQEIVRVDLDRLSPDDYEVIDRPGVAPWVRFKKPLDEATVERVGPLTEIDRTAADQASPELREAVVSQEPETIAARTGLTPEQAQKGIADVRVDGMREIQSPEAVAVKRATLELRQEIGAEVAGRARGAYPTEAARAAARAATAERAAGVTLDIDEQIAPRDTAIDEGQERVGPEIRRALPEGGSERSGPGGASGPVLPGRGGRGLEPRGEGAAGEGVPDQGLRVPAGQLEPTPPGAEAPLIPGADEARARIRERAAKLGRGTPSLGVDPALLKDYALVGADYVARGARDFATWSGRMVSEFGESIRQHLRTLWRRASAMARDVSARMEARYGPSERGSITIGDNPPPPKPTAPLAEEPIKTEVSGHRVRPEETPRVEHRVEDLRAAEKESGLSQAELDRRFGKMERETKQTWESLDPKIKRLLRTNTDEDFYNIMKRRNLDADETQAWDAITRGKQDRLEALHKRISDAKQGGGQPPGELTRELVEAELDFIAAQRASVNDGTGLARALAARARVMDAARTPDDRFLRQVFREIPNVTDAQAAAIMQAYRKDPAALQVLLHAAIGHGKVAKALEWFRAGLLSAFSTDVANFSGNLAEHHIRLLETGVSGGVDRLLQRVFGGDRARFSTEVGAEWAGGNAAFGPALKQLAANLKDVVTLKDKPIDLRHPLAKQVGAIGGTTGKVVRTSFRKLEAMDAFFKQWGGSAETGKLAHRKARRELGAGATKDAIRERTLQIIKEIADPANTKHTDIMRAVSESQSLRAFQEIREDSITEAVGGIIRRHPMLGFVGPFIRTPGNIANRILERSPYGFKKASKVYAEFREVGRRHKEGKASAEEFAEARGRLAEAIAPPLIGTAMLGAFTSLAAAGGMTGSGPTDPKEKNALRDTGWAPYSFVFTNPATGKKFYVPYNRFEPISSILGFAADIVEAGDAKTAGDLFDKGLGSIVQNLSSKSYLQGLTDAAELISDPKQFASQYVRNFAGAWVPNIIGRTAQAIDPTFRDTRPSEGGLPGLPEAVGKTLLSRIPGASMLLSERRAGTGELVQRPGGAGLLGAAARFVIPAPPSAEREGRDLERLMVEAEAVPSAPARDAAIPGARGRKVRLSDEEYRELQLADKAATDKLRRVSASPRFKNLDPLAQKAFIERHYQRARNAARRRLWSRPDLRKRARQAVREARA